jgi:hypothetical protein
VTLNGSKDKGRRKNHNGTPDDPGPGERAKKRCKGRNKHVVPSIEYLVRCGAAVEPGDRRGKCVRDRPTETEVVATRLKYYSRLSSTLQSQS